MLPLAPDSGSLGLSSRSSVTISAYAMLAGNALHLAFRLPDKSTGSMTWWREECQLARLGLFGDMSHGEWTAPDTRGAKTRQTRSRRKEASTIDCDPPAGWLTERAWHARAEKDSICRMKRGICKAPHTAKWQVVGAVSGLAVPFLPSHLCLAIYCFRVSSWARAKQQSSARIH